MSNTHIPSNFKVVEGGHIEEKILLDADTGEVILQGDYYHDKIDEMLEGFKFAMDFFGYAYTWENAE